MLAAFARSIIEGGPSPCDEMAGYLATYLGSLAVRSIETGRAYPVPLDRAAPVLT
jgi:hypothetical protein